MSSTVKRHPDLARLLELLAAESIDDLNAQEVTELESLRRRVPPITDEHGREVTGADALSVLGAVLAASVDPSSIEPIKPQLRTRLIAAGEAMVAGNTPPGALPARLAAPARIGPLGWVGWAAALVAASLFVWQAASPARSSSGPQKLLTQMLDDSTGTVRFALVPQADAAASNMGGEVIWKAGGQEGFLHVHGLARNDPAKEQYQLWIVDGARTEAAYPVDGGVFDSTSGFTLDGHEYIYFRARLPVTNPTAFVITVESPGGAVVSKQLRVVAAAAVPPGGASPRRGGAFPDTHWPPR